MGARTSWRALAAGAEVAAAAGDDDAADARGAVGALLPFATVHAMVALVFAHFARRVHIVGNRRAAEANGILKNTADGGVETAQFFGAQRTSQTRGMNARAPQAFIGINIPQAAQDALIQQQGLDSRSA